MDEELERRLQAAAERIPAPSAEATERARAAVLPGRPSEGFGMSRGLRRRRFAVLAAIGGRDDGRRRLLCGVRGGGRPGPFGREPAGPRVGGSRFLASRRMGRLPDGYNEAATGPDGDGLERSARSPPTRWAGSGIRRSSASGPTGSSSSRPSIRQESPRPSIVSSRNDRCRFPWRTRSQAASRDSPTT